MEVGETSRGGTGKRLKRRLDRDNEAPGLHQARNPLHSHSILAVQRHVHDSSTSPRLIAWSSAVLSHTRKHIGQQRGGMVTQPSPDTQQ